MEWQKLMTDCGAPLYVFEMPYAQSVSSAVFVRVGSRDEEWPQEAGLAHALEHMMFHGTRVFPSSQAFAAFIEKTGGILNAFTGDEVTAYWNCVPPEYFLEAIFSLKELVLHPLLPQEKAQTEMRNIIEEMKMYYDQPREHLEMLFQEALYKGHPLSQITIGRKEAVESFSREDFVRFRQRFCHPENFAFFVVGNIKAQRAKDVFNTCFAEIESNEVLRVIVKRSSQSIDIESDPFVSLEKEIDQANIKFGWAIPPAISRETKALRLFSAMLSHGMSSPLFQEVREKRGLCYAVRSAADGRTDASCFYIYIGTDKQKAKEAVETALRVAEDNKNNGSLLRDVQKMVSGGAKLSFEQTSSILWRALIDFGCLEEPRSPKTIIDEIQGFTIEEIEAAVDAHLTEAKTVKAMVIPRT